MKKILTTILVTIISVLGASAQTSPNVLKLKNGSVINCTALEADSAKVKVKTVDGSIWVFKMTEVEVLQYNNQTIANTTPVVPAPVENTPPPVTPVVITPTPETAQQPQQQNNEHIARTPKPVKNGLDRGFFGKIDLQAGTGDMISNAGVTATIGYQLSPHLSIGIGSGIKYNLVSHSDSFSFIKGETSYNGNIIHDEETLSIPLFTEIKINFSNSKVSPFISSLMGYNFAGSDRYCTYNSYNYQSSQNSKLFEHGNNGIDGGYFAVKGGINIKTQNNSVFEISGIAEIYGGKDFDYQQQYKKYSTIGVNIGYSF